MVEVLPGNALSSTLNGSILSTDLAMTIQTADASTWPPTGDYRVLLFTDPVTGPFELVHVTGGQGTAVLTISRAVEPYNGVQAPLAWPSGTPCNPVLTTAGLLAVIASTPSAPLPTIQVDEQVAVGLNGATSTSGWDARQLSNIAYDNPTTGVTLASHQLTIPAGTWEATWHCTQYNCGRFHTRLYDVTDSVVLAMGSTGDYGQADAESFGQGQFVLAATKVVELQQLGGAGGLFGLNNGVDPGVFASLKLRKLA